MPSEKEKYAGYREYFRQDEESQNPSLRKLKPRPLMPSTIETIDRALVHWIESELNIFATTNKGWKKVNLIWVANERAFQIKDNKDLRDANGRLILPLMTVNRTSLIKDPQMKGVAWANVYPINDARGGALPMAVRLNSEKTGNVNNVRSNNATAGRDQNAPAPLEDQKPVYDIIYSPMPIYVVANYELILHAEYQQQLNEMFSPFLVRTNQINNFFIYWDGHKFEGFIEGDFSADNNISNLGEEERKYQTTINLKILAYLLGEGENERRPKMATRETIVKVGIPRERVILGDTRPWEPTPKKK
jgi:hypothetical protein